MYAHTSYRQYWMSGKRDAAQIMAHIERFSDGPIQHVAEWGCGLARILRHLPKELIRTGYDYNPEAIKWGQENLRQIRFYHNDLMPPLECEADSVDAVYSISVFTHLSQAAHHAWIDELYRILRPGGLLLFTVHGCPPEGLLLPHEQAQFDKGALVTRGKVLEGSRIYTAYHPKPYVRERLLAQFHILAGPVPEFGQTLWIAQKPIA
ncbi:MAG: class I SAM-dependent methyltransferase [bacterium]